ncbi:MAG: fibrobacter succinogenes major paralogous domain-containing protein [Sphingobacteriales bacterium]|nr:fibrobacter succinogenes major paralogous domain-containing protein [Sphingobacteriales bacterium]
MVENLKTTRYNDGSAIPTGLSGLTWEYTTSGAYAIYNNDPANKATYGMLYNWHAVNTGKLAPAGWHVPTDAEWTILTTYLGGDSIAGRVMKSINLWLNPNIGSTNSSGFTGLPAGWRDGFGSFGAIWNYGYFGRLRRIIQLMHGLAVCLAIIQMRLGTLTIRGVAILSVV